MLTAPTTLALASSLLSMSLSRSECKRHIAVFSAATPIGAFAAYGVFTYLDAQAEWTGLAILVSVSPLVCIHACPWLIPRKGRKFPLRRYSPSARLSRPALRIDRRTGQEDKNPTYCCWDFCSLCCRSDCWPRSLMQPCLLTELAAS